MTTWAGHSRTDGASARRAVTLCWKLGAIFVAMLLTGCAALPVRYSSALSVTPAGDLLVTVPSGEAKGVYRVVPSTGKAHLVWQGPGAPLHCATAERNRKILSIGSSRALKSSLWILDPATGEKKRLTDGDAFDVYPVWEPEGGYIYFLRAARVRSRSMGGSTTAAYDVWRVRHNGGQPERLTNEAFHEASGLWIAPGGKQLFVSARHLRAEGAVYKKAHDGYLARVTEGTDVTGADDGTLAFLRHVSDTGGYYDYEVVLRDTPGKERVISKMQSYLDAPVFSPDGSHVYVLSDKKRNRQWAVAEIDCTGGEHRVIIKDVSELHKEAQPKSR